MSHLHKYLRSLLLTMLVLATLLLSGCDMFADQQEEGEDVLYVYSWGDYLSEDVIKQFEEETGIKVVLDEYDTNESMYPRIAEGAEAYDVLCPSDYMINKLIHNDLLMVLAFIDDPFLNQLLEWWLQNGGISITELANDAIS